MDLTEDIMADNNQNSQEQSKLEILKQNFMFYKTYNDPNPDFEQLEKDWEQFKLVIN